MADEQEDREGGQDGGIGYEDWESENDDEVCVKSLFDDTTFGSIAALLEHDERVHGFRLQDAAALVGTDDLHLIMLVNLIRRRVRDAGSTSPVDASFIAGLQQEIASRAFLSELDTYMLPVLAEDPLLYLLRDALGGLGDDDEDEGHQSSYYSARQSDGALSAPPVLDEYQDDMRQQVESYRSLLSALSLGGEVDSGGGGSSSSGGGGGGGGDSDGYYFDSYAHIGIHETMLRDRPRTSAYAAALAAMDLRGKVLLDVGCGTGILCMLAARAGAKKVIGVDFSGILDVSRRVIAANGFGDVVTLVRGRVEEIDLGPDLDEVDVIVSEWMGYGLYYENMLASVIHARKEFLAPTGVMLPSHALLYVEALGAQGAADRVSWWGDVYGFDMTLCAPGVTTEAQVQLAPPSDVMSTRGHVHTLDCLHAEDAELDFSAPFSLQMTRAETLRAFVVTFDVDFRSSAPAPAPAVVLSTAVQAEATHWKHAVLWLEPAHVEAYSEGDAVAGTIEYKRRSNPRDYDVIVTWKGKERELSQTFMLAS